MSHVDVCLLSFHISDKEELINEINSFFIDKGFVSCNDKKLPFGWYGGERELHTHLFLAAFNYFDEIGFIEHLKEIKFKYPDTVQLIIQREYDEIFEIINIFSTS